ncbi:hypothetical protein BMS3Abin05_00096 [bacterium BMS3Abin05]|nr:hypothetical protein BMS3Abin05_00096 [bacterium BMS3Abin05]GBE26900.1 hypothetical protein BMS3Bbin03_00820 [bacterium BMS3Bbin03]
MKKILILGSNQGFGQSLSNKMKNKGYKIKCTRNIKKAQQYKEEQNPNFILFTGKMGINKDGTFYFEF